MPLSTIDGRGWVIERIAATTAPLIIDGGAGEGTYSIAARHLRDDATWLAVEIFAPYADRFLLDHKYDRVQIGDLREMKPPPGRYVILLGDVLEHMPKPDAIKVLRRHLRHAEEIMVSVPIVHSPQEACYGNEHEAHLYHWGFEEMADLLPGCETFQGVEVGRYWWKRQ